MDLGVSPKVRNANRSLLGADLYHGVIAGPLAVSSYRGFVPFQSSGAVRVKVGVSVPLGSPSLINLVVSVDVKQD